MCRPKDAYLDVIEIERRRRKSGNLGLLLAFGGSLFAVLGVGAWQTWENLPRLREHAWQLPVGIKGCAAPRLDTAMDRRTVYHISGCQDQKEYWIIQIEPNAEGEKNGPKR